MVRNKRMLRIIGIIGLSLLISWEVMGKEPLGTKALAQKGAQTIEEKYVRKELISFTWGTGTYQLGSNWREYLDEDGNYIGPEDAWCESVGPSTIKVNNKGNIFILDAENERILIFSKIGKYVTSLNLNTPEFDYMPYLKDFEFDSKDNLYFLWSSGVLFYGECGKITKFTPELKFEKNILYKMQKPSDFDPQKIKIRENGIIVLPHIDQSKFITINFDKNEITKKYNDKKYKLSPCVINKTEKILEQRNSEVKILSFHILKHRTIKLKRQGKFDWVSDIIKEDEKGNISLLVGNFPNDKIGPGKARYSVHTYNSKGELVLEVLLDQDDRLYFIQDEKEALVNIDKDGNIYHLWIQKEGPKIIKWEKQK